MEQANRDSNPSASMGDEVVENDSMREVDSSSRQAQAKDGVKQQRKRTKTGCLTCRKRRIKCGEERPECTNCVRSRRYCEGYLQRYTFKTIGSYGPDQGYGALHNISSHTSAKERGSNLLPIAPKLYPQQMPYYEGNPPGSMANMAFTYQPSMQTPGVVGQHSHQPPMQSLNPNTGYNSQPLMYIPSVPPTHESHSSHPAGHVPYVITPHHLVEENPGILFEQQPSPRNVAPEDWQVVNQPAGMADNDLALPIEYHANFGHSTLEEGRINETRVLKMGEEQLVEGVEEDPNDPWDVMDEDIEEELNRPNVRSASIEDLQLLRRVHAHPSVLQTRSYTTFLNTPNVLARYHPSYASSPLNDEKTARIFAHFVAATGQSITVYERNFTNTASLFSGQTLPLSKQGLWTYTMPSLALEHPPLLHAILALGALHISKLQETSIGPSSKHFHYALRRVSKLIGLPHRRNEIATLATNLVLGFYEVMCAEHSKWTIHLQGAKILIMEFDFAATTRTIRQMRDHAKALIATMSPLPDMVWRDIWKQTGFPDNLLDPKDWEVDDKFISELTGMHVRFNDLNQYGGYQQMYMTEKDIDDYKVRSDLFWWYCKQDLFQSMMGGNDLIMPYEYWTTNPPRSQFGRIDAPYGTFDHLVLLMARLADWGAKDRKRKMKVMTSNGGRWKPPPGFFPNPPSGQGPSTGAASTSNAQSPSPGMGMPPPDSRQGSAMEGPPRPPVPTFHGMMPPKPAQMESAYADVSRNLQDPYITVSGSGNLQPPHARYHSQQVHNTQSSSMPNNPQTEDIKSDLDVLTERALEEHAAIARAFETFAAALPSQFQPLPPTQTPPIDTPFGPAIQYRRYVVACIQIHYNCGLLLLHRLHPHMPPAAMMATGVSARKTAEIANTMGRICGGLYSSLSSATARMATPKGPEFRASFQDMPAEMQPNTRTQNDMNPALGAALMESTFPVFFAAVQFVDPNQRKWTITRLRDIARCTGWQTSAAVASGCEAAWQRMGMGQAGGPPKGTPPGPGATSDRSQSTGTPHDSGAPAFAPPSFPTYISTSGHQDKDVRTASLWREREKMIQALRNPPQPQPQFQPDGQHFPLSSQPQPYTSLRPLGPLWQATGGVTTSTSSTTSSSNFDFSQPPNATQQPPQPPPPPLPSRDPSDDQSSPLPLDLETPAAINHDRRFIGVNPAARVHWAIGILGLEKDMQELELGEKEREGGGRSGGDGGGEWRGG